MTCNGFITTLTSNGSFRVKKGAHGPFSYFSGANFTAAGQKSLQIAAVVACLESLAHDYFHRGSTQ